MTRRRFLTGLGVAATAAVAGGYGVSVWTRGGSATHPSSTPKLKPGNLGVGRTDRTLVVVELGGGNDGLNTVVPFADPAYTTLRPTLGLTDGIHLDDSVALHPKLAKLAARYQAGHVAIVEGVGYPDPNLSHFASLASWWAGAPGSGGASGWLGRYLDGTVGFEDPLAAIGIGPTPSPALLGDRSFATSIADASGLQPQVPAWVDGRSDIIGAWAGFVPGSPDPRTLLGQVQQAIHLTVKARTELDADLGAGAARNVTGPSDDLSTPTPGTKGRGTPVSESLRLAAQLVTAKHPPRVIYVSGLGDYDTHQGEAQRHPVLLEDLDAGLGVRAPPRRERRRDGPRNRRAALRHRRQGERWSLRAAAVAHAARRPRQLGVLGGLPVAVRDRGAGLARRRRRGDRRQGLRPARRAERLTA